MDYYNNTCGQLALDNTNFRKVLFTTKNTQLVLMSIPPGDDIPQEVHNVDQIIIIVQGQGEAILNGTPSPFKEDSVLIIPAGTEHQIKNTGPQDLKLYTFYAPPEHAPGTIHRTKEEE